MKILWEKKSGYNPRKSAEPPRVAGGVARGVGGNIAIGPGWEANI